MGAGGLRGVTEAMCNVALLLDEQGAGDEAQAWWRTAAQAGHGWSMLRCAALVAQRGGEEARWQWLDRAARQGYWPAFGTLAGWHDEHTPDTADAEGRAQMHVERWTLLSEEGVGRYAYYRSRVARAQLDTRTTLA